MIARHEFRHGKGLGEDRLEPVAPVAHADAAGGSAVRVEQLMLVGAQRVECREIGQQYRLVGYGLHEIVGED